MARYARVTTISMNPGGGGSREERIRRAVDMAVRMIDRAAPDKPDLIVLPETFTALGCGNEAWFASAEPVPGPTSTRLAEKAREHRCHIVCPIVRRDGERTYNSAVLLDRNGEVAGIYNKIHPTISEINVGITPGTDATVVRTDFGRVGFAICFDLNFRDVIEGLAANSAELVVFPSMYRGGLQTQIWAHDFGVWFASSTPGEGSVIVDPLGTVVEKSDAYEPIISRRINLDYARCHIDENYAKWEAIKSKYGESVELDILSPEAQFILYSHHPDTTALDIVREFSLEPTREYYARANRYRAHRLSRVVGAAS
jgi:predicted amidohydrolase